VATDQQVAAMAELLRRCCAEGALGFSTSQAHTHNDGDGQPVPSRSAARAELEALCRALSQCPGTTLEIIVPGCINGFSDEEVELLGTLSLLANRPANWNVLGVSAMNPDGCERQLAASDAAAARGAVVVALTLPHTMRIRLSFEHGAILDGLPGWRELFALPKEQRLARLSDPAERRRLAEGAASKEAGILGALANWKRLVIEETFDPANAAYEGRTVGDVAAETGKEPFDALLDVVVADGLRTGLRPPIPETEADWELRAKVWQDPRTIVGGSDAGAHLDVMCGAIYSTSLLGDGVRKRSLLSWEEAVRQLTEVPARLYGLRDRGRITEGGFADLVLFDPTTVGHGPERTRDDLPGGTSRLYAEAEGIEHVLVNGTEIVTGGKFTGELPGAILRSGADTDTVTVPGGKAA
jgi:N-acyl-D-aspartate/D-glutamate deacylase